VLAVVSTQPHPYHIQVLTFWFAVGPVAVLIALIIFTAIRQRRRMHRRKPSA
jgi:hypothetical protein